MEATCANCGLAVPDDRAAHISVRPPCPNCGSLKRNYAVKVSGGANVLVGGTATMDVRSSFTVTFMCACAGFARQASDIEVANPNSIDDATCIEHRGLVIAAVMQSVAALEAESWEVTSFGPGHHLGSNGIDVQALNFLQPLAGIIDRESVLNRYWMILHLLRRPPLDRGTQPWQDADLLVRLRNELVHYKSKWGQEMERQKLFKLLKDLHHPSPPFVKGGMNFFPHECLSAACAKWAVRTAAAFIESFYDRLDIPSPLKPYSTHLTGL
jgi:hypothetical protein